MSRGPSRDEFDRHGSMHTGERGDRYRRSSRVLLSDGTDISRMTVAEIEAHRINEEDSHRRRIVLMRMQGKVNRQEMRMYIWFVAAGILAIFVLVFAALS
jgi:hypothetical protein